ncbi:MAG: hypothetical protein DYH20_15550 [Gammaproteobacteria bacterium PRO9]|nr:hypothetical protein [Gammaproteobacteria bacterium PRO9]
MAAWPATSLASQTAETIFRAFEDYNRTFGSITRRAERRFLAREWQLGQRDAAERIELYDRRVETTRPGAGSSWSLPSASSPVRTGNSSRPSSIR